MEECFPWLPAGVTLQPMCRDRSNSTPSRIAQAPAWRVLTAAVIAFSVVAPPVASRPLAAISAEGVLRVGLTGDYAPFSRRDPDGQYQGADVVMAQSLARALHLKLEVVATSWGTLAADLAADRFDIAMGGVSVTPDRAAIGDFSLPVLRDGKRPIVRCADQARLTSLADIDRPEVRVVVNPGGTNERFARNHLKAATIAVHADNRTIFEEIAENRADVMITDGAEVDYQARRHPGVLCAASTPEPFDLAEKAFWMTRDRDLKVAVDRWLGASLAAGDYDRALAAAAHPGKP